MSNLMTTAMQFFDACESGKGWEACQPFCHDDAAFEVQAESLAPYTTVEAYSDHLPELMVTLPDAHYKLKCQAVDEEKQTVMAYAHFCGTHTGPGGPVPPTGKYIEADYAFIMQMRDGKVSHVTKIWNDTFSIKELGWA
jgi:predicted ester cyclase